jgi:hypothetical protein
VIGCSKPAKHNPANLLDSSLSGRLAEIVVKASDKSGQNPLSGGTVVAESADKASAYKFQQVVGSTKNLKDFMESLEEEVLGVLASMDATAITHSSVESPGFQDSPVIQISWNRSASTGGFQAVAMPTSSGWTVYTGVTESSIR